MKKSGLSGSLISTFIKKQYLLVFFPLIFVQGAQGSVHYSPHFHFIHRTIQVSWAERKVIVSQWAKFDMDLQSPALKPQYHASLFCL